MVSLYPYFVDTPATAEYVCDVIVNSWGKDLKASKKASLKSKSMKGSKKSKSKSKSMKGSKSMKKCLKKFNALPNNDSAVLEDPPTRVDGNSKGCIHHNSQDHDMGRAVSSSRVLFKSNGEIKYFSLFLLLLFSLFLIFQLNGVSPFIILSIGQLHEQVISLLERIQ